MNSKKKKNIKQQKENKNSFSSWPISRINVNNETRFLFTNETFVHSLLIFCSIPLVVLAKHGCKCNNKDCEQNEHSGQRRFLTSPMELLGNEKEIQCSYLTPYLKLLVLDEVKRCHRFGIITH